MTMNRRAFMRVALGSIACSTLPVLPDRIAYGDTHRRPNILLILADDMGYSDADCYGGEVRTPNLTALAENGLRFSQHYSTGRCWPSRACLLSGYYAQHIRRDHLPGIKMGNRPDWAPLVPELIQSSGYRSYHSGKWHIDGTPKQGGFERSWGGEKSGCDWNRFFDTKPWQEDELSAPVKRGEPYYSTIAIADHAIACLKLHQQKCADQPFFQYVAFYSPHFPLHALQKDIDSYDGTYDKGWDTMRQERLKRMKKIGLVNCDLSKLESDIIPSWNLSEEQLEKKISPGEVAHAVPWNTLSKDEKTFQAKKMAIHAAMITRMDNEIGRIIDQLKAMGQYDNTLILFMSDNGASAEQIIRGDMHDKNAPMGSAKSFLCLGPGWSTAANTPFRLHKHWNHEGGISSPLIVHWPDRIKDQGKLRHDVTHFVDIAPTILDVAGVVFPDTSPAHLGKSLLPAIQGHAAIEHDFIWWAHEKNRAIRQGKWKLSARKTQDDNTGPWELYDLSVDRCEMNNLASKHPDIVKRLDRVWNDTVTQFKKDLSGKKS